MLILLNTPQTTMQLYLRFLLVSALVVQSMSTAFFEDPPVCREFPLKTACPLNIISSHLLESYEPGRCIAEGAKNYVFELNPLNHGPKLVARASFITNGLTTKTTLNTPAMLSWMETNFEPPNEGQPIPLLRHVFTLRQCGDSDLRMQKDLARPESILDEMWATSDATLTPHLGISASKHITTT